MIEKKTKDTLIQNILDNFDFDRVYSVMKFLNWTYAGSKETPTIKELKSTAKNVLEESYRCLLEERKYNCSIVTGGFYGTCRMPIIDNEEMVLYFDLKFVLYDWDVRKDYPSRINYEKP